MHYAQHHASKWTTRTLGAALSVVAVLTSMTGCVPKPEVMNVGGETIAAQAMQERMKEISADPIAHLRLSLEASRKLKTFRTKFHRQERLGLIPMLKPGENMLAEYRDEPFSVRFTWLDKNSEYLQCCYIEGQHNNKVVLLPRKNIFGGPGTVDYFDPVLGVIFHKTRNPITDFGPRRMMERTLDRIEKAKAHGDVKIELVEATEVGASKAPCFHFEIHYPLGDQFACKLQDLYIHTTTHLPVATRLWLTDCDERSTDTLDGAYVFSEMEPNIDIGDETFVIDADAKKAPKQDDEGDSSKKKSDDAA